MDAYELRIALFRRFWIQLAEQPPNHTANDQICYCCSPEAENTLVQSVIVAMRFRGSELICALQIANE